MCVRSLITVLNPHVKARTVPFLGSSMSEVVCQVAKRMKYEAGLDKMHCIELREGEGGLRCYVIVLPRRTDDDRKNDT